MVLQIIGLVLVAAGVLLVYCPLSGNCNFCEDTTGRKHPGQENENLGLAEKPQ
jgi:hypothetical protein